MVSRIPFSNCMIIKMLVRVMVESYGNKVTFFTQYSLFFIVLGTSLGNLMIRKEGEMSRFWSAMVGTCLGHIIPTPKLKANGGEKWKVCNKEIDAKILLYAFSMVVVYLIVICCLINLSMSSGKDESTWIWAAFLGTILGYMI